MDPYLISGSENCKIRKILSTCAGYFTVLLTIFLQDEGTAGAAPRFISPKGDILLR